MRKVIFLLFILIAVGANAQFKVGIVGGGGVRSESVATPVDSFATTGTIAFLGEVGGRYMFFRSGYQYYSPGKSMVPTSLFLRLGHSGAFLGGGFAFATSSKNKNMYEIMFGNKFNRSVDFHLCFSHPLEGDMNEAMFTLRLSIFPLSTCVGKCEY